MDQYSDDGASLPGGKPQFFDAVGTHVLLGRGITQADTATSTHVAVVNQSFVNHYLKGKDPIGAHFGPQQAMTAEYQIIGVVEDTKYRNPSDPVQSMYFTPMAQYTKWDKEQDMTGETTKHFATTLVFRFHGDPTTVSTSYPQCTEVD